MSILASWIHTSFAEALGWALVHFVWEGAALAILLMAMLAVFRHAPARRRYVLACLVLAAMPLAFAITLALLWERRPITVPVPIHWLTATATAAPVDIRAPRLSWRGLLDRLPWLVPMWSTGVAFFCVRGLAGWVAVRRLRRRGVCAPTAEWQTRLNALTARLRISHPVVLLESCMADAPVMIGYLRPVILLPLGCLTGLSTTQVECILLHELAHVARHDYLVNLLQSVVEGLLFYHPAVWWVSRVVRAERENCCDDRVVELMGDARAYAATLAALEERRAFTPQTALAANGGNLMKRIRRLTMDSRASQPSVAPAFSAAMLLVLFAAALSALPVQLPTVRREAISSHQLTAAFVQEIFLGTQGLMYIATEEEREQFRSLGNATVRSDFVAAFWQRRGEEGKREHYRRLAYVNEHFGGAVEGWKTDRGRIYITYGPPDNIEELTKNGQRWHYRYVEGLGNEVAFEFSDRNGRGDLILTVDPTEDQRNSYRAWINEDVAYIVTDAERAEFQALTSDAEREEFIVRFWQRCDPAMRDEHYRRIAYANQHFQTGAAGWKTDRGRVYITYGPPDEVQESGRGKLEWKYRSIQGMGNNVSVVFEDPQGNGEYRLIKEPRPAQATVFASKEPGEVSVIVSHDPIGAPGIIGIGDVLHVDYTATASDESRIEAVASRQEQERPIRAELYTSMEKLRHLNSEWEQRSKELHDVRELSAEAPTRVRELNQLSEEFNGARGRYWQLVEKNKDKEKDKEKDKNKDKSKDKNKDKSKDKDKEKDELELQQAELEMEARQQQLAVFRAQNQLLMPETLAPKAQAMTAAVAELDRAKDNEKMRIAVLEKNLNQLREKNPFPASIQHVSTEISVGSDGSVMLDNNLAFTAAGRTPAQLEAAIGAGSTVRILNSRARMVVVLVPVGQGHDPIHVYGEIRAGRQNKIAQAFEEAVAGQPAVAKTVPLRAGSYHLSVVWKNMTSGATHNSDLDFTVD